MYNRSPEIAIFFKNLKLSQIILKHQENKLQKCLDDMAKKFDTGIICGWVNIRSNSPYKFKYLHNWLDIIGKFWYSYFLWVGQNQK